MTAESGELEEAWIKRYVYIEKDGKESPKAAELFWAFDQVDDVCRKNPEHAIRLILNILGSTKSEFVLANLAAGPLETLLAFHGKQVILEVERLAKANPNFRSLLRGVWQNLMDDQTWGRVLKAAKTAE